MRKTLTLLISVCIAVSAMAQISVEEMRKLVDSYRVHASYSFVLKDKVSCSGEITVQRPCFKACGNGLEVYCDGKSRWMVDREAKEVYIEAAESEDDYLRYLDDVSDLKITNVSKSPQNSDLSMFLFDESVLDSSWVVTDLR